MYSPNETRNKKKKIREENGLCIYCGNIEPEENKKGCRVCLDKKKYYNKSMPFAKEKRSQYQFSLKHEVIKKYGGQCSCCGEKEIMFLTIDHINNDGYKDEDKNKSFYYVLRKNPIREDLQVMCFNCNCGKAQNNGICPHKLITKSLDKFKDDRYGNKTLMDKNTKIDWPENDKLVEMCNNYSIGTTAKKLGICYTTLTKRLKNRNLSDLITKKYAKKMERI